MIPCYPGLVIPEAVVRSGIYGLFLPRLCFSRRGLLPIARLLVCVIGKSSDIWCVSATVYLPVLELCYAGEPGGGRKSGGKPSAGLLPSISHLWPWNWPVFLGLYQLA